MHRPIDQQSTLSPEQDDNVVAATQSAGSVLAQQRQLLAQYGAEVVASNASAELASLAATPQKSHADAARLLRLALTEIADRQTLISSLIESRRAETLNSITLDALVHAMHRIRTSIDIALGCSEEITELTDDQTIVSAARQSAAALRMIYHYSNELDDLVSLASISAKSTSTEVRCCAETRAAIMNLTRVAHDAGVLVSFDSGEASATVTVDAPLLRRTLSYLVLISIISPGVKTVRCAVALVGRNAEITFAGDGHGTTLEQRAAQGSTRSFLNENLSGVSDASGFAVARRLARLLGGELSLEIVPGKGDTLILGLPRIL